TDTCSHSGLRMIRPPASRHIATGSVDRAHAAATGSLPPSLHVTTQPSVGLPCRLRAFRSSRMGSCCPLTATFRGSLAHPPRVRRRRRAEQTLELARKVRGAFEPSLSGNLAGARAFGHEQESSLIQTELAQIAHRAGANDLRESMRKVRSAHAHVPRHL